MSTAAQQQRVAAGVEALVEAYARLLAAARTSDGAEDRTATQDGGVRTGDNVEALSHKLVLAARTLLDVTADIKRVAATSDFVRMNAAVEAQRQQHAARRTAADAELQSLRQQLQRLGAG